MPIILTFVPPYAMFIFSGFLKSFLLMLDFLQFDYNISRCVLLFISLVFLKFLDLCLSSFVNFVRSLLTHVLSLLLEQQLQVW